MNTQTIALAFKKGGRDKKKNNNNNNNESLFHQKIKLHILYVTIKRRQKNDRESRASFQ